MAIYIVDAIKSQDPPGRFLEIEPTMGSWVEVDDEKAIEKTCQTFRKNYTSSCKKQSIPTRLRDISACNYFNHANDVSVKDKPFNRNALVSIDLANKLKRQNTQPTIRATKETEEQQAIDLSSYNNFIFSNLQKYYREKHQSSAVDDMINQSLCRFHDMALNENEMSHPQHMELEVTKCNIRNDTSYDDDKCMSIMKYSNENAISDAENRFFFIQPDRDAIFREKVESTVCINGGNVCSIQEDDELDDIFMAIMDPSHDCTVNV